MDYVAGFDLPQNTNWRSDINPWSDRPSTLYSIPLIIHYPLMEYFHQALARGLTHWFQVIEFAESQGYILQENDIQLQIPNGWKIDFLIDPPSVQKKETE